MTKQEFKKAKSAIIDFKATRILMGFRLVFTMIAFILSIVIVVTGIVQHFFVEVGAVSAIVATAALYLFFDPISLFSLVYYGAYSSLPLSELMNRGSLNWMTFKNWGYSLATIGCFILGFIILMLLFKALKKSKTNAGMFIWFLLFLTVENFACIQNFGWNIFNSDVNVIWAYWIHAVNIVSIIMCCRSTYCTYYLNSHFEQGTALKMYELKKMYCENQEF